jgi:hypothetical protein
MPSLGDRIVVDVDSRLSITQFTPSLHACSRCRGCLARTSGFRRSLANRLQCIYEALLAAGCQFPFL